jgi:hypothetical protein
MVNFKNITDKAKELVEKRGGTDSLKEDAAELKDIAGGEGSIKDKAKAAVDAVKDPGAEGPDKPAGTPEGAAPKAKPEHRGKHHGEPMAGGERRRDKGAG